MLAMLGVNRKVRRLRTLSPPFGRRRFLVRVSSEAATTGIRIDKSSFLDGLNIRKTELYVKQKGHNNMG